MCLVALALGADPRWPVVLVANRDEATDRPAAPLAVWPEGFAAGRDLEAGGTWLGAGPGRWCLVTNVRDPEAIAEVRAGRRPTRSRGSLPVGFLTRTDAPDAYARAALDARDAYGAFNLLVGASDEVWFASAREDAPRRLARGVYGLSNATLDTPWPKTVRVRERLADALARGVLDAGDPDDALLALLDDTEGAPDDALPDTGIGRAMERVLAAPRIVTPAYGTRVTTVLRVGTDGSASLTEQTWAADGSPGARHQVAVGLAPDL